MKVLTIDTYFNVLEKCTLEAFESLKVKDFYPKNGTKAIWDVSSLTIKKNDGLLTENEKELFKNEYIKENLSITFLLALERNYEKFNTKYSIERSFFYKKCYESLVYKLTQSELFNKPDFGFNVDKPNVLTFLNYNKINLIQRSKEQKKESIFFKIDIIKTPQSDINIFLNNKVNIEIYDFLVDFIKKNELEIEPLNLFNLIFKELNFYFENHNNYIEIQNHFNKLNYKFFEFIALEKMLNVIDEVYQTNEPNQIQLKSYDFLKNFFKQFLCNDIDTTKLILDEYKLYKFKNRIKVWKTDEEKINYLIDIKSRFLSDALEYKGWEKEYNFDKECDIEINRLKSKIAIKNNDVGQTLNKTKLDQYKNMIWFKTGIKLATGEAFELYRKYKNDKGHFSKINLELGFKDSDRPYFSETINDNKNSDKNTFANKDKLKKLYEYLIENDLPLGSEFLKKYSEIEPD